MEKKKKRHPFLDKNVFYTDVKNAGLISSEISINISEEICYEFPIFVIQIILEYVMSNQIEKNSGFLYMYWILISIV